jgi:hypothetical protein
MNYYSKYLKYKNKYLLLKSALAENKIQLGGEKPFLSVNYNINFFTNQEMNDYLNPIYGLIMCESGYVINNYYLAKSKLIDTPESQLIEKKICKEIPGSIQPTNDIMKLQPIDFGRYIAIKYINMKNKIIDKVEQKLLLFNQ